MPSTHDLVGAGTVLGQVEDERIEHDQRGSFEKRSAELTAVLAGTATTMSAIAASELSSRVVIAKTRAPTSPARRAKCSDTGVSRR
jgi:hypothetical protein